MICGKCGFTNAPDARFCMMCGENLVGEPTTMTDADPWVCTNCGTENVSLSKFCRICGASLKGALHRSQLPAADQAAAPEAPESAAVVSEMIGETGENAPAPEGKEPAAEPLESTGDTEGSENAVEAETPVSEESKPEESSLGAGELPGEEKAKGEVETEDEKIEDDTEDEEEDEEIIEEGDEEEVIEDGEELEDEEPEAESDELQESSPTSPEPGEKEGVPEEELTPEEKELIASLTPEDVLFAPPLPEELAQMQEEEQKSQESQEKPSDETPSDFEKEGEEEDSEPEEDAEDEEFEDEDVDTGDSAASENSVPEAPLLDAPEEALPVAEMIDEEQKLRMEADPPTPPETPQFSMDSLKPSPEELEEGAKKSSSRGKFRKLLRGLFFWKKGKPEPVIAPGASDPVKPKKNDPAPKTEKTDAKTDAATKPPRKGSLIKSILAAVLFLFLLLCGIAIGVMISLQ